MSKIQDISDLHRWGTEVAVLLWSILTSTRVLVLDSDKNHAWLFVPSDAVGHEALLLQIKDSHCQPGLFPVDLCTSVSYCPVTTVETLASGLDPPLETEGGRNGHYAEGNPCLRVRAGVIVGGAQNAGQASTKQYELALSLAQGVNSGLSTAGLKTLLRGSPWVVGRVNKAATSQAIEKVLKQAAASLADKVKPKPVTQSPQSEGATDRKPNDGRSNRSQSEPPRDARGTGHERNGNSVPPAQDADDAGGKWHQVAPRRRPKCTLEMCDQFNAPVVKDLFPGQHGVLLCSDRATLEKVVHRMRHSPGLVGAVTPQDYKLPGLSPRSVLVQVRKMID
eukprot:4771334-Amphidinium_carterae.1